MLGRAISKPWMWAWGGGCSWAGQPNRSSQWQLVNRPVLGLCYQYFPDYLSQCCSWHRVGSALLPSWPRGQLIHLLQAIGERGVPHPSHPQWSLQDWLSSLFFNGIKSPVQPFPKVYELLSFTFSSISQHIFHCSCLHQTSFHHNEAHCQVIGCLVPAQTAWPGQALGCLSSGLPGLAWLWGHVFKFFPVFYMIQFFSKSPTQHSNSPSCPNSAYTH